MEEETSKLTQKDSLKRRSSIFQRRSIIPTATNNTLDELDATKDTNEKFVSEMNNEDPEVDAEVEEPFDLNEYIKSLKREKQDWQKVLQERRTQHRSLAKKKANLEKTGQEVDLTLLTESERNFIESRPNYEEIIKSNKALVDMAVKVAALNQHCNRLYDNLNAKIDTKIKEATKKIISMVD